MRYQGSKLRLARYIIPIIQGYITPETKGYLEPFVGGANVIDKIKCKNKIGSDIHPYLIELLKKARDNPEEIPRTISEAEYMQVRRYKDVYPEWYVGLVGFCASFGTKFFGGWAKGLSNCKTYDRDVPAESISGLKRQSPHLKDVSFYHRDYRSYKSYSFEGFVIYCDAPYKNTTKYSTGDFDHEEYYRWLKMMARNNTVLVSEYDLPDWVGVKIWERDVKTSLALYTKGGNSEKLYLVTPDTETP